MNKIFINIYTDLNTFFSDIEKILSMGIFNTLSNNMFIYNNNENDFIESVFFKCSNDSIDVTNKFKWLYKDNINYSDLKKLYNEAIDNEDRKSKIIEIKTLNNTLLLNVDNDKYYIKIGDEITVDDIVFDSIPLYLL